MKIISSELYVKDNKVYHEGNKPKPKDIGAAPETHTHNYASATTPGGSAEHAIKATEDSLGQRIDKYIKGLSVSGRTITYTRGDGTTGTITTQDNDTDTKVTNTLNTTAKAYITGTTESATNTGTQVFDTNVYLDTTAGMLTATTFKGALQGNATTATSATSASHAAKLTTPRSINGTNFDGTAAITTANWGTARTLTIGNTGKSVNGSGNVSWSIGEIGAAPTVHNHTSLTGVTNIAFATEGSDSASITTTVDGANTYFDFNLSDDPSQNDMWRWRFRPSGANVFNAMTLDAISTTEAKLAVTGEVQATRLKGTLTGDVKGNVTGTVSGNAGSATKLATARTINGTSFDGTGNITTANWGTARTLTVGSASKSVNGSANVTWSLDEIGARPRIKKVIDLSNTTTYPVDKWYPCLAGIPYDGMHDIEVAVQLNSGVKPSWATHDGGFTCNLHVKAIAGGWGTTTANSIVLNHSYGFASANPCSYSQLTNSSNAVLWLRGGGKYFVFTDWNASWSVKTASTEISSQTVAPATSCPNISLTKATMIADLSGNATTATTLQTTRTINGTNFNGSANITTANWGTARNIQIGNTSKSVNGSSNVSWSLSEIGALSLSGGTLTGLLSTPNNQMGIKLGDDVLIGDGNIANNMVLQGSQDSTLGGITFGSGKDTNIYRGGANLLKTDDTMNAVGGFQWNGQSLDNRYIKGDNIVLSVAGDVLNSSALTTSRKQLIAGSTDKVYAGNTSANLILESSSTPQVRMNNNNFYPIYHTGNKPTASEIGAAASNHTHSSLIGTPSSTIAPSTEPGMVRYDYNVNSDKAGTLPCVNNANGILTINTHHGNYYSQLGFSSNGNLYYRAFNGAALDTTTAWKQVAFTNSSITGNATTATKLQTARTIALGGILSGSASFDGSGNVTINATANDITTITKSLNVTTSWMDTGITGSNLATGTYAVQMLVNDGANTAHYNEYYSGIMSWYADGTNSTDADEILLHKAGHASNGRHVYLRTIRTGNSGRLKLQISCTHAFSAASNITFKFKKLI